MRFEQQLNQKQKQTQKLAMTQELQQSIQMLQYNTDELLSFLESKVLENPLMELKVESNDYETPIKNTPKRSSDDEPEENNWINQVPDDSLSLFDFLIKQIHLNYRDTHLRQLVLFLVEYIDVNGYLTISLEEAEKMTKTTSIEMLDALTLIQLLEPIGVGARDLRECLMLQIEKDEEAPDLAYIIVEEYFEELASRKWDVVRKAYDIDLYDVQQIFDYIQKLSPNPGARFNQEKEMFIHPDVIVKVREDAIEVLSTKRGAPQLIFQQAYFDKMNQVEDKEVKDYLKNRKNEFDWIKRGVLQRGNTILKVAEEIVKRQTAFFLDKNRPLVPMQLKEIAKAIDVHESTISRSVNGKYLETSFGIFELRSFFTTGLAQKVSEEEVSADTIKKTLLSLVAEEDKNKPLSDQKLVDLLLSQEIQVSRRTIAKYRDELQIPASSKRKRYDRK
ncbi:MAG: RNA polymerase factor sigma-54 [Vagococcus sp.]|uniref:RNA polymerase factor sigma-54 n=1 Tax=Vagococcus sp. TaxID=1933889 RepID=UPI002FCA99D0